jgi:selenide,water dikinase
MEAIRLTQFSHGAGCGCKIAPGVLEQILDKQAIIGLFPQLLVGNEHNDDAAVYALSDEQVVISTTDFFMPIVDDPAEFGAIASANALSDIYAMGGRPIMAIAILGWPVDKIPVQYAGEVLKGAREKCMEAGIPLAGGHSIDSPEPIFGLAVTGISNKSNIKRNSTANQGDLLYLTKRLGVGILTTAQKKGLVSESDYLHARHSMSSLNQIGGHLGDFPWVHAMTDVTGFGLLGHLIEMCEGASLSAEISESALPIFDNLDHYIQAQSIPGGTHRNWKSYEHKVTLTQDASYVVLADPQTSGGLLVAIDPAYEGEFEQFYFEQTSEQLKPIGSIVEKRESVVYVVE